MKNKFLVLQTDFGLADGAVSAMQGVAYSVAPEVTISHLTHEIQPYNIHDASYRLFQTVQYWPAGTVFVSVVDPGVGSNRRSIVAKTSAGQYIVTPDNGTLAYVAKYVGLEVVKEINEEKNRLPHSEESHTFHGRDVYVYNGALIADDEVYFNQLEKEVPVDSVVQLDISEPHLEEGVIHGVIDILDIRFGSLWTNIPLDLVKQAGIQAGDTLSVRIYHNGIKHYDNQLLFGHSFADVPVGETVAYTNSLIRLAVAINQQNFSKVYGIGTGNEWQIEVKKVEKGECTHE
ncbi:SAM hydrolase/SAM-dependent halogenase family protein [Atopococcus tabaci]|uniref:SAM hydrolase/SAM-dependent halogenase family protein n=1 Tax=Atopococcus tabaci TaxID=269774 RepID=UPI00040354F1|nr:S-adenosyl-l-methionine hydroxide adenosyltransferase family protein [Atopococcus tabaci]